MKSKLLLGVLLLVMIPFAKAEPRRSIEDFYERLHQNYEFSGEEWEMQVEVDTFLDMDGNEIDANSEDYQIMIELRSDGNILSGNYVQSTGNACSNAEIEGEIDGNEMTWVVTYSGSCCPEAQMEFEGKISFSGYEVEGELSPIGLPPENCWIWYADVKLVRQ